MAHKIYKNTKDGVKTITLLNPSERAEKYVDELKTNSRFTNDRSSYKADKNGDVSLTKEQRAFRAGYLEARKDSANAFISKHSGYRHKTVGGKARAAKRKAYKAKKK